MEGSFPDGDSARRLDIISGLVDEVSVPDWVLQSGTYARVGDDLRIVSPEGEIVSVPGYFAVMPPPILMTGAGGAVPALIVQAGVAAANDIHIAQANGFPAPASAGIEPGDDPSDGNFDLVGIGGQQNRSGPAIPPPSLEKLLTAIAAGENVEQALQAVFQQASDEAIAQGVSPETALHQYEAFANILSKGIAEGVSPVAALGEANSVFVGQGQIVPAATAVPVLSPEQSILAAIASGNNAGEVTGGSQAFQQALADALQQGSQVNQAMQGANAADDVVQQALAQTNVPGAANPLLMALASGENLGQIQGSAAFQQALSEALANGQSPSDAAQNAAAATDAIANAQNATSVGGGDPTLNALASGNAQAIGGSAEFLAALSNALQGNADPVAAMAAAAQADSAIAQGQAAANVGGGDATIAALASGDAAAIGGSEAMQAALSAALQGGADPAQAMTIATQVAAAVTTAQAQANTGGGDPALAALASGNVGALGDSPVALAALADGLANNLTPAQAAAQAQQTEAAVNQAQQQTSVGDPNGGLPPEVAAVVAQIDAANSTTSDNSRTSPSGASDTGEVAIADQANTIAAENTSAPSTSTDSAANNGQVATSGEGASGNPSPQGGTGAGSTPTNDVAPIPNFAEINKANNIADNNTVTAPVNVVIDNDKSSPSETISSTNPSGDVVVVADKSTPPVVIINHSPTEAAASFDQIVSEGSPVNLSLSSLFTDPDGDVLTYTASGLPAWATLSGSTITGTPTADGTTAASTIVITANDGRGLTATKSFTFGVNDKPNIDTEALSSTTSAPISGPAVAIDSQITFNDADTTNFNGATLRVAIDYGSTNTTATDDRLSLLNIGTGVGQIGFDATPRSDGKMYVTYAGADIGFIATIGGVDQDGTGGVPLVMTLTSAATQTAVEALMRAVSYRNLATTPPPSINLTLTEADGTQSNAFHVDIAMVNNLPPTSTNVSLSYTEDVGMPLDITTFDPHFSDPDGGDTLQKIKIDVLPDPSHGVLKLYGVAIAAGTIINRVDIVNHNLIFVPNPNFNNDFGATSFVFTVSDGKQFAASSNTASIGITAVNDAPTATIVAASAQFHSDTAPILIAPQIAIADVDATSRAQTGRLTGGFLEIDIATHRTAGDRLSIDNIGTGAGQIGFDGTHVTYGGVQIGTVALASDGGAGETLRVTLDAAATPDAVQALARAVTYNNVDGFPGGGDRTVTFTVNDGIASGPSASATVSVGEDVVGGQFHSDTTALTFNGSTDYVSVGTAATYAGAGPTTWEAWIKTDQTTGTQTIFGAGTTASSTVIDTHFNNATGVSLSGDAQIGANGRLLFTVDDDLTQTTTESGDWDGTTATTGQINVGGTIHGSLDSVGGTDWVRVVLQEGRTYQVSILGKDGANTTNGTLEDPDLQGIFDANGNQITSGVSGDLGGAGNDAIHSFTAPYSGEFYIGVYSANDDDDQRTGSYTVNVARTSGSGDQQGVAVIAPPTNTVGATNFSAAFDLYIASDGSNTADGFSFNYGTAGFRSGVAEEGVSNGLSVVFDTFDNDGAASGDVIGIEVWFNGAMIARNTSTAFESAAGKAVSISYSDAGLTVKVGVDTVFDNLAVAGYAAANKTSYQYILGGRAAAVDSTQEIDNLLISAENTTSTYNALVVKNGQLAFSEGFRDAVEMNSSGTTVADGNWHHVAASFDGNQTLSLYVDGVLVQTLTGVTENILAGNAFIGRSSDSATDFFNGSIAEVRVWGDARTATEIGANYIFGLSNPGSQSNLEGYWSFNGLGNAAQTVTDQSGNGHTAILGASGAVEGADPTVNMADWKVIEGAGTDDSVVISGGEAIIRNGELLQTFDQLDPGASNPIHVTGRFAFENAGDALTILTRADAGTLGGNGLPTNGIVFKIDDATNAVTILKIEAGVSTALTLAGDASVNLTTGVDYDFDIVDDGTHLALSVHEVGASTNTATVTASSAFNPAADYVVVTNVQDTGTDHMVHVSDIQIDDDFITAEGTALSGTLSARSPLTGTLTYSLVDAADHGTFAITDAATGAYTYTPAAGYHGRDFVTYQVVDTAGRSHVESVIFDVTAETDVQIAGAHLKFDGANDYVTMGAGAGNSLQIAGSLTIEGWFKIDELKTADLVSIGGPSGDGNANNNFLFNMQLQADGRIALSHEWGTGTTQTELLFDPGIQLGDWVHLTAVRDAVAKTYSLYADGALVGTQSYSDNPDGGSAAQFMLGAELSSSSVPQNLFHGSMDDVRVWDYARSADDIRLDTNQTVSGPQDGLIGQWSFDNVADGAAKDLSGTGNTAQLGSSHLGDTAQPTVVSGTGQVMQFDGVNDTVSVGRGTADSLAIAGDLTLESWVKFDTLATDQTIVEFGANGDTSATNIFYNLRLQAGGDIVFDHQSGSSDTNNKLTFDTNLVADQWYHIAAVRDVADNSVKLYINGVFFGEQFYTTDPTGGSSSGLLIGAAYSGTAPGPNGYLDGQLDDVRIWNTTRSATEIAANYQSVIDGTPDGLVAQYTFDDGTATNTVDHTSGVLNGGVHAVLPVDLPDINGSTITIAENSSISGDVSPNAVLVGAATYSVLTPGDHGGTVGIDAASGRWTYTPLANFNGTETFTLHGAGATSGTNDETIVVTVENRPVPSVNVSDGKLQLDGAGGYVSVGSVGTTYTDMTIEIWVKLNDLSNGLSTLIASDGVWSAGDLHVQWDSATGKLKWDENNGAMEVVFNYDFTQHADVTHDWFHLAIVKDAQADTLSLYINGELTDVEALPLDNSLQLSDARIGAWIGEGPDAGQTRYVNGEIDEFRVWNTARTAAEIATNYDLQLTGSEANLQGYWRFDAASGTTVADQTANHNDGTITGGATIVPPLGNALNFDGVDDHVTVGRGTGNELAILGDLTIESWAKFDTLGDHTIAEFGSSGGTSADNVAYTLRIDAGGDVVYFDENGTGTDTTAVPFNTNLVADQWYHLALVRDATDKTLKLYVNGELFGMQTYTTNPTGAANGTLMIGESPSAASGFFMDGELSDVRIWNVARTDAQIADNYNHTLTGTQTGLVANYAMDGIVSGSIVDSAGANNGTVVGGATIVDTAPDVFGTALTINENETVSGAIANNDVVGTATYSVTGAGSPDLDGRVTATTTHGTVVLDTTSGAWTFTPTTNYHGTDSFTLMATGAQGTTDSETISVAVTQVDHKSDLLTQGTLQFDGVNDYVSLPSGSVGSASVTIETWFKWDGTGAGWQRIFDFGANAGNPADDMFLSVNAGDTGKMVFIIKDHDVGQRLDWAGATPIDQWTHVAVTIDAATDTGKLYINGDLVATNTSMTFDPSQLSALNSLLIGASNYPADPHYAGDIADFRIWSTAQSADEIRANYDQQLTGSETGLQANYRFDDVANGIAQDASTHNRDATLVNGVTVVDIPPHALSFDGVNDSISLSAAAAAAVHASPDITIETWFKWDGNAANAWQRIFDFGSSASAPTDFMFLTVDAADSGKIRFSIANSTSGGEQQLNWFSATPIGQWTHVAVTIDSVNNVGKLYINGVLVATNTSMTLDPTQLATLNSMLIGQSNYPDPNFSGDISNFRIWDTVRSASEIAATMNSTLSGTENGELVVNLPLNEGAGAVAHDTAGTATDGTISGATWDQGGAPIYGTALTVGEDQTASGQMTGNDVVIGTLAYSVPTQPADGTGTVTIDASSGAWVYAPPENWSGTASFTVRATGGGLTDSETVTVTVKPDADPDIHQGVLQLDGTNDTFVATIGTTSGSLTAGALNFDGVDDYVKIPNTVLNGLSSGTIEAWVYLDSNGQGTITAKQHGGVNTTGVFTVGTSINAGGAANPGTLYFHAYNDANAASTVTVPTGGWHHVAVSFSATGVQFYIDGQAVGTTITQGGPNFSIPNIDENAHPGFSAIGAFDDGSRQNLVDGQIAEVRVWDDVRSAQEIADNYNKQLAGGEADLRAYYRLDGTSQTVEDLAGNADGTLGTNSGASGNDPSYTATGPTLTGDIPEINLAAPFTMELWVRTTATGVVQTLMAKSETGVWEAGGKQLGIDASGHVFFDAQGGGVDLTGTNASIADGNWHHVAFTYTGAAGTIYVDGTAAGSAALTLPADDISHELFIGSRDGTAQPFNGQLDEVRIWSDARTGQEIADNYDHQVDATQANLVAYYRMDDMTNGVIQDATGHGNDISVVPTHDGPTGNVLSLDGTNDYVTISVGHSPPVTPSASALTFDGVNDYVNLPNAALNNLSSGTIEAWIRFDPSVTGGIIMAKQHDSVDTTGVFGFGQNGFINAPSGTRLVWHGNNDAGNQFSTASVPTDGAWHQVAVSFSGTTAHFYIDGVDAGSASSSLNLGIRDLPGGVSAIGGVFGPAESSGLGDFKGDIAEVRIWDDVRTTQEISDNYNQQLTGSEANLHAYYRLDETGQTMTDYAGTADGTLGPDASGTAGSGPDPLHTASGPTLDAPTGSLDFSGTWGPFVNGGDYVKIPNSALDNLSSGTIEAWVNLDMNDWETITAKQGSVTSAQFGIGAYTTAGKLSWYNSTNGTIAISTGTVATGGWHHVAVTFDSSSATFYIDGQPAGTVSGNFGVPIDTNPTALSSLGAQLTDNDTLVDVPFSGEMAEVRIWNDVRTAQEIAANYNQQLTGTEANLQAYYRLDDTGQTVTDYAGNADGTLGADGGVSVNDPTHGSSGPPFALPDIPDINLGATTFTLEAWIKTSVTGAQTIMAKTETGSWLTGGKELSIDANGHVFFDVNGGSIDLTGSTGVVDGNWHHVAFTYNAGTGTIYVDGNVDASGAITLPADNVNHEIFVGSLGGVAGSSGQYFNGQIDEVRIWDTARDAGQIREGMTEQYDFDEAGLTAHYSFEDGATNSANAYGSSTFDGTLTNGATTADSGSGDPIIVHPPATALNFDGANDVVTFGAAIAPTGGDARTFMLWAKTSSAADQTFLSYGNASAVGSGFGFGLNAYPNSGQGITVDIQGAAVTFQPITGTNDGQWHNYAVVVPTGASLRDLQVYQDGVLLTGIAILAGGDPALATNPANSFTLGTYVDGLHDFNGQMADVSVWNTALTTAQIRDYITHGVTGSESGLAALWNLDEGSGTSIADTSGHSHTGTASGATWVDGAPDVQGNFVQIAEDGLAAGQMTHSDVSGTPTYSLGDGPHNGSLQVNSVTGEWVYVPTTGYQGEDTFTLKATGATAGIDDETVDVRVGHEPVAAMSSALSLDATHKEYVDLGTLSGLSGDISVEAWVKFDSFTTTNDLSGTGNWQRIVDFSNGVAPSDPTFKDMLFGVAPDGHLALHVWDGTSAYGIEGSTVLQTGEWYQVAATIAENGSASLYLNGQVQDLTFNITGDPGSPVSLPGTNDYAAQSAALPNIDWTSAYIGHSNFPQDGYTDGQISDVRVWNDSRSTQEIADNYDKQLNGDEQGLYAYWKLDEGSGTVAHDDSGNGHDGTVVGGASYTSQTQISVIGGSAYQGMVLGADGDHSDALSYAVADHGDAAHGNFAFDTNSNTYAYTADAGYHGADAVTVAITDDHHQATTETLHFTVA